MWTNERWCFRMLFYWATFLINKHNIPLVICYHKDNKQEFWGSRRAKSKLQSYYSRSLSFKKSFSEDQSDLNMPGTYGHIRENPENVHVRQVLDDRTADELPAKLPSKLNLCRLPELGNYIGEEMMRQYRLRGGKLKKKFYGKEEFKMDDWDEEIWPWAEVKGWKNAKNFPKSHGTQTEFYRKYIQFLFEKNNLDPDTWVEKRSSTTKSKEHRIKKRNREQIVSDSESDKTSSSSSNRHNRSRSLPSSEDGENDRVPSVLTTITEAFNENEDGDLTACEQGNEPLEPPFVDTEATTNNIEPEQSTWNIPLSPHVQDPVPHTQAQDSDDSDTSYEEIICDSCKISSNLYVGRWHRNQSCEDEYLCEKCFDMIRARQASANRTRQTSAARDSSPSSPSPPNSPKRRRTSRRPTNQENNVTPMLLRLRTRSARNTEGI